MKPFLVYKSSAGSGKTYTLVKEYLKIILSDPQKVRNILAITFTNAAAAEMKQRVIEALGEISSLSGVEENQWKGKGKALTDLLTQETPLKPFEVVRRAQMALTLILHNYGDFSISTIDSFVHRVIRSFAFDLQLPLNFDVELDQDQLLNQAVDILVSRAGTEIALTRLLVQYIESRTDDEKSHYIEYDIAKMARTLMDEKGAAYVERLKEINLDDFVKIHASLGKERENFETEVSRIAGQAIKLMEQNGLNDSMFYQGARGIGGYFKALAQGNIEAKIQPNSYALKTIEENKWAAGKADAQTCDSIDSISPQLTDLFNQIQQLAAEKLELYRVQALVRRNLFPLAVLSELEKIIDEIKTENAVLHISDFNRRISEIVAEETAPFIYERLGERYQHYMIDEFQDTSGLQWQNLLPLVDNSLASGNMNLVVGDGKQAIYRWRNGDVEQFAALPQLPDTIKARLRDQWQASLMRNYNEMLLDTNYRSRQEIISFNNSFFGFAKNWLPESLAPIYEGQEQKHRPDKPGGYVQLEFIEPHSEEGLSYTDKTLLRLLDIITGLREQNHPLSDITVLCRANKEASNTARFLLENNLNVISGESLLLSQSPAVNFIITIIHLLHKAEDKAKQVEFAQFLIKTGKIKQSLADTLLEFKNYHSLKKGHLCNSIHMLENWLKSHSIEFSFNQCLHLGLYELTEFIVRSFFKEEKINPYIAFFMDVVYDYSNRNVSSIPAFLEWWSDNSDNHSVVVPEGVEAVQVMTIHKSKGLQFPVVIYPFVDMGFGNLSKKGEWVNLDNVPGTMPLDVAWISISKALQQTRFEPIFEDESGKTVLDILNVVYVAFTRAIEKLFILSAYPPKSSSTENISKVFTSFLEHKGLLNPEQDIYSFGECFPVAQQGCTSTTAADSLFAHFISEPWQERVSLRSMQLDNQEQEEGAERGLRIHEIMEKINTPADVEKVLDRMYKTGLLDVTDRDLLKIKISNILAHPLIEPWYKQGLDARNECGMYDSKGRFLRADRIVIENHSAVVIDYKTGKPYPHHKIQISDYAAVVHQMGYSNVKKYIVYLDENTVELV